MKTADSLYPVASWLIITFQAKLAQELLLVPLYQKVAKQATVVPNQQMLGAQVILSAPARQTHKQMIHLIHSVQVVILPISTRCNILSSQVLILQEVFT